MDSFTLVNKTVTLVGKRNCGKSHLLRWLVGLYKRKFRKIFVVCPTEKINHFYEKSGIVSPENIFEEWKDEWCEKLIDSMTTANAGKDPKEQSQVLIILDDCVSDANLHQSKALKKLYTRGRHLGLCCAITTQHLYSIPPVCRANSDFILCGQQTRASLNLLCEEFQSGDVAKEEFMKLYQRATKDFGFFTINCNSVADGGSEDEIYGVARTPQSHV